MKHRVARYQADRTNQKLYFSRIYCQLAEQTTDRQLIDAHVESALMHLYGGYLAFLQELVRYYGLSLDEPSLEAIANALQQKTQVSPEVLRLQKLYQHDFLGEIAQAWQQILYKPIPAQPLAITTALTDGKLPIIDVMAGANTAMTSAISVDMVRQWRLELLQIIDTLREGMVEF